jgi:opacity protein-like surface antigen
VNRLLRPMRMYALLLVLMMPGPAAAQTPADAKPSAAAAAAEESLPRWDTTGFIGWRGTRVSDTEYSSDRWDGRLLYGGTLGYYWTTNLKLELDVSATAPSTYDIYEPRQFAGVTYPFYVRTDHRTKTAGLGGLVIYQFFENVGFHPFVGAGAGWVTTRERISTARQTQVVSRGPTGATEVVVISEAQSLQRNDSEALGQIVTGFKGYPGERVFFRTDVLWTIGGERLHDVSWRIGFGVDF